MDILSKDFEKLVLIYDEHSSLEDRVRDTGVLTRREQGALRCGDRGEGERPEP